MIGTQARAQDFTVSTGQNPVAIAINPVTDRIYVANLGQAKFCEQSSFVTIIDGPTNNTWSAPAGLCPGAVAVNPATNLIYVVNTANFDVCCANVTVIDGVFQGSVTNITVGGDPQAAAVNPITNKIYVTNNADDTVTVIDGATNATTTVPVGSGPMSLVVNPVTNKIYVGNFGRIFTDGSMTVIDGATNATTTVPIGPGPGHGASAVALAVNPATNLIYVVYGGESSIGAAPGVTIVDGATNAAKSPSLNLSNPNGIAVNPATGLVYVTDNGTNTMAVINWPTFDSNPSVTTLGLGNSPNSVAVNPVANKIYVAFIFTSYVAEIDGATDAITHLPTPERKWMRWQ